MEQTAYRKLLVSLLILIIISALIYLKGLDFISFYSSLWQKNKPLSNADPTPTPASSEIVRPTLNPIASTIKENMPLKITGHSQAGSEIMILVNNQEVTKVLTNKEGSFQLSVHKELKEGENTISVYSLDDQGHKSEMSETHTTYLDTMPPELKVLTPKDKDTFKQSSNIVLVSGQTESEKITITINDYRSIVNLGGNFSYNLPLNEGKNKIIVVAEDQVGHQTTVERTVFYQSDRPVENNETTPNP